MNYEQIINFFEIKAFEEGLDKNDYEEIKYYLNLISGELYHAKNTQYIEYLRIEKIRFESLKRALEKNLFRKIHSDNIKYLQENTYLLPLVYRNYQQEQIKLYSPDSYMFSCQFHHEKKPSMGVTFSKNLFFCFGCGSTGNQLDYLMQYENLTFLNSAYLLAQIYFIPFPNNPFLENHPLVTKYQSILLQQDFLTLLDKGIHRLNQNYKQNGNYSLIQNKYQHLQTQIARIQAKKKDSDFQFKPLSKTKILKLEIPKF